MGLFWVGFSLSYVALIWVQRASAAGKLGRSLAESFGPATLALRLTFTVLTLIGALGAAGLVSEIRTHIPWADAAFLFGLGLGLLMALWPSRH